MKFAKILTIACLLVGVIGSTGCQKDLGYRKTTGTVTMDGQPVEGATVTFYSASTTGAGGGSARTDANGAFDATASDAPKAGLGLMPGEYTVTVVKSETVVDEDQAAFDAGEITYDELQDRKAQKGPYAKAEPAKLLTPEQYASSRTTPLKVTVSDDPKANVFDFNLDE